MSVLFAVTAAGTIPDCLFSRISTEELLREDFACGTVPSMSSKRKKKNEQLKPHDYIVSKRGNVIQIVALIERTPNMVIVRIPKAA